MPNAYYDVFVLGDGTSAGLAYVRSLGRRGLRVLVGYHERRCLEFVSRYAAECLSYPPPWDDARTFAAHVLEAVERHAIPLVIPVSEPALAALDAKRSAVEAVTRLAAPPSAVLRILLDKERLIRVAAEAGIPVPRTMVPRSVGEGMAAAEEWGYPVILKPQGPIADPVTGAVESPARRFPAYVAESADALRHRLVPLVQGGVFPLLQEFAPGWMTTLQAFAVGGDVVSLAQFQPVWHLRPACRWTPTEARVPDPTLTRYVSDLLGAMAYDGLVRMEFVSDRAAGRTMLVGADPGPAMTVAGGVRAGQDIPWMLYHYYRLGQPPTGRVRMKARATWITREVQEVAAYVRNPARLGLSLDAPSRWGAVARLLRDIIDPRIRDAVCSWRDPVPGLVDVAQRAAACFRLVRLGRDRGAMRYGARSQSPSLAHPVGHEGTVPKRTGRAPVPVPPLQRWHRSPGSRLGH